MTPEEEKVARKREKSEDSSPHNKGQEIPRDFCEQGRTQTVDELGRQRWCIVTMGGEDGNKK